MENKLPLVSVVLPNFNHAPFISKAIKSLLCQEYTHLELILIDDGSTDNSHDLIQTFCTTDSRIKYIQHKKNRGVYYSLNEGLALASGAYIAFTSADDYYLPRFFKACMEHLMLNTEIGICASDMYSFTDSSNLFCPIRLIPQAQRAQTYDKHTIARIYRKSFLKLGGSNTVLQTQLMRRFGGFNAHFHAACDWFVLTKIALTQGLHYIPEPLICRRVASGSLTDRVLSDRVITRNLYSKILDDLSSGSRSLFEQFKLSGELGCVFKFAPLEILKRPKFWSFTPIAGLRYLRRLWRRRFVHHPLE